MAHTRDSGHKLSELVTSYIAAVLPLTDLSCRIIPSTILECVCDHLGRFGYCTVHHVQSRHARWTSTFLPRVLLAFRAGVSRVSCPRRGPCPHFLYGMYTVVWGPGTGFRLYFAPVDENCDEDVFASIEPPGEVFNFLSAPQGCRCFR